MKLLVLSDLHLEFYGDTGASFLKNTPWPDHDVCVIAGDLSNAKKLLEALNLASRTFDTVVYVTGNHEYYGSSIKAVDSLLRDNLPTNVHWLDCGSKTIQGQVFTGGTLWFAESKTDKSYKSYINDFRMISDHPQIYGENGRFMDMLPDVMPDDIVVTHHLPSFRSVSPQYQGSPLNASFVHDVETSIRQYQPQLWIHGHTHSNFDYNIGRTRVVCNPRGYPEENKAFSTQFVIEV